ncbi:Citramalyl-CoA lyase, mitochondrial [Nymphon striatum]|nr:Citramalyl-CoA lyase, mitochondrial [Nymphon striatum]
MVDWETTVESVLVYGCEMWTINKTTEKMIDGTYTKMLMTALDISWRDHVTNEEWYPFLKVSTKISERKMRLAEHCVRHEEEEALKLVLLQPLSGRTNRGKRRMTYIDTLLDDTGLATSKEIGTEMMDRSFYHYFIFYFSMQMRSQLFRSALNQKCFNFTTKRSYTPRRALLYVPGSDEKKIDKIRTLGVDCAVLDCEDGVALNKKDEARSTICKALNKAGLGNGEICVRPNSIETDLFIKDFHAILQNQQLPSTLVIPKVESKDQIEYFADELNKAMLSRGNGSHIFKLIVMVESAKSLLDFRKICQKATELSETSPFMLEGVIFGSDDFCADVGITRTSDATELLYARQKLVTISKLFKIQTIDLVHIDYKDLVGLRKSSEESSRMGFTGKQIIHPCQVDTVHQSYSPSEEKIMWATELIQSFNKQQGEGKGAIVFQGSMIDMPLVLQAKNILKIANVMKK